MIIKYMQTLLWIILVWFDWEKAIIGLLALSYNIQTMVCYVLMANIRFTAGVLFFVFVAVVVLSSTTVFYYFYCGYYWSLMIIIIFTMIDIFEYE